MSTLEELGARAWINHYPAKALKKNLSNVYFRYNSDDIDQFCHRAGLQRSELRQYGRVVRSRGYAKKMAYKEVTLAWNKSVQVLRSVRHDWDCVDGRVPQIEEDTVNRYQIGPAWANNSCTIDATLFCGLRLDAGRIQADQLSLDDLARIEPPARMFRRALQKNWGSMSPDERNHLRDRIRKRLVAAHPHIGTKTSPHPIETVVESCFEGLPQLTYTDVHGCVCCDDRFVVTEESKYARKHFLSLSAQVLEEAGTIEAALSQHFGESSVTRDVWCSHGADCKQTWRRCIVVVDRMPPVLMVSLPHSLTPSKQAKYHAFRSLRFEAPILQQRTVFEYEPLGCIMMHSSTTLAHFTARWLADRPGEDSGRIICHDGLQGQQAYYVDDWNGVPLGLSLRAAAGRRHDQGPVVMFYKQKV